jgi:anti-anti-sigma factor
VSSNERGSVKDQLHDRTTIVFDGELDLAVADQIRHRILAAGAEARQVELDLGEVTFFDSSALRAVIDAQRSLADTGSTVYVGTASRIVDRVLGVSGAWDILRGPAA